jgi:K+-sensing histidine kinase KdpD
MPRAEDDTENLFYLAMGPMAAILLGAACVPLRGLTTASNFAFAFVALTIVVAELGGRWAAVATALCSALSLDFFLTEPYMRLTIYEKHDAIAVLGLTVCGLIAAAFGSQRGQRTTALATARKSLDLLHAALSGGEASEAVEARLTKILRASRDALPLAAAVVRDERDRLVASADPADAQRPVPDLVFEMDTLLPAARPGQEPGYRGLALPESGGRIALVVGSRRLGWLDVWGNGTWASPESRRTLSDLARSVAILLAGESARASARD